LIVFISISLDPPPPCDKIHSMMDRPAYSWPLPSPIIITMERREEEGGGGRIR